MSKTQHIQRVNNPIGLTKEVRVVGTAMISSGAVGYYVGAQIGGMVGTAVESIVDAFIGKLAVELIHEMSVMLEPDGTLVLTARFA